MKLHSLGIKISVSDQISLDDVAQLAVDGIEILVCNRPDGEADGQLPYVEIQGVAEVHAIQVSHIPFSGGQLSPNHVNEFKSLLSSGKRVHMYCRTGNRSTQLWAAAHIQLGMDEQEVIATAKNAGFEISDQVLAMSSTDKQKPKASPVVDSKSTAAPCYDVVIVGAGSGGIAAAASLLKRKSDLRIVLIDPSEAHYYQPGWTMVGGGVFDSMSTYRQTKSLIPRGVSWIQQAVASFSPAKDYIELSDGKLIYYRHLVVSPGLTLNWGGVEGLEETLGRNGVTSNYRFDLAPYTWKLVSELKSGKAIFTQPPMPIKCAGAPQKALYLSADHWQKSGMSASVDIHFYNAGGVLFGVKDYVPALQSYIDKYNAKVHYSHNLVKIDGDSKTAWFKNNNGDTSEEIVQTDFEMIHVCPPQIAPQFVRDSELSDGAGWLDVDKHTLRHTKFENVWGLGDVMNTPNAKTMAAVRKQVPVVATNIIAALNKQEIRAAYDGYGSCPLTVERGKIVLAEFGYGGKLLPSFPQWLIQGTKPTRLAWLLKSRVLPDIYWHAMLKGREWMAAPKDLHKMGD